MNHLCLFMVRLVWFAAGSGSSVDGYVGFLDEARAKAYITLQTSGRDPKKVPDKYMNYEIVGLVSCHSRWISNPAFKAGGRGHIRIDNLEELKL